MEKGDLISNVVNADPNYRNTEQEFVQKYTHTMTPNEHSVAGDAYSIPPTKDNWGLIIEFVLLSYILYSDTARGCYEPNLI